MKPKLSEQLKRIDPATTAIPFFLIAVLCGCFLADPAGSERVLSGIRSFLGDEMGLYYLIIGLGVLLVGLYIAFSDIGKIRLGKPGEKPQYSFFAWGSMLFTAGIAADILFYSTCEWLLYAGESRIAELGSMQDWASTMPLFHWGPIPWGFYAVLAAAFGYMLHVRGCTRQKYSEACRPILGRKADGAAGKVIDVLAVLSLIAGTATTFSLATPLLSAALTDLFGLPGSKWVTIGILAVTCAVYTVCVMRGIRGVSFLANTCMYVFFGLLAYVLFAGGKTRYILETGFSALGRLVQHFPELSTYADPLRTSSFPQNWTIFYWAYWLVWCVAAPFFMGSISRGRTVKQVILGALGFGMASTFVSFIILGNYGLGLQMAGELDIVGQYAASGDLYGTILSILHTLPCDRLVIIVLIISMIAFYATSFDSITLVASAYSYRRIGEGEEPGNAMKLFWAILLTLLPVALIFSDSTMSSLQSVSIIAAFPIGIVICLIIAAFIKDARRKQSEDSGHK